MWVCVPAQSYGCVRFSVTLQIVACQPPLSVGFPWEEYWSGLPFPSPEDLPDPGIKPTFPESPALQPDSLPLSHQGAEEMDTHSNTLWQESKMLQPNEREFANIYGDYRCIGLTLQQSQFLTFILQVDLHVCETAEVQDCSWWHCSPQQNNGSSLSIQGRGGQVHPHSGTE